MVRPHNQGGSMTDLSLYNIAEEQEAITALLEMDQGEITEDHDALIEQVEQMIAQKTDRVVGFFNYLTDEIGNAKKRKDEIVTFIKVREAPRSDLKITSTPAWKSSKAIASPESSLKSKNANPPRSCTLTTKTWCQQNLPRWKPP